MRPALGDASNALARGVAVPASSFKVVAEKAARAEVEALHHQEEHQEENQLAPEAELMRQALAVRRQQGHAQLMLLAAQQSNGLRG